MTDRIIPHDPNGKPMVCISQSHATLIADLLAYAGDALENDDTDHMDDAQLKAHERDIQNARNYCRMLRDMVAQLNRKD